MALSPSLVVYTTQLGVMPALHHLHEEHAASVHPHAMLQEQKNMQLGQIFAHGALVKAGRLSFASHASATVAGLAALAAKRPFMAEASMSVIADACDQLDCEEVAALVEQCEPLSAQLCAPLGAATPEALQLALHLWPRLPKAVAKRCPLLPRGQAPSAGLFTAGGSHTYTEADAAAAAAFFAPKHLSQLTEVVRQSSSAMPRLHSVWQHMLRLLLPGFAMRHGDAPPSTVKHGTCAPGTPREPARRHILQTTLLSLLSHHIFVIRCTRCCHPLTSAHGRLACRAGRRTARAASSRLCGRSSRARS
jgi:DNA polymerase phi